LAEAPVHGFELNVSCPNTKAGGTEFGADPCALREVVSGSRAVTDRPLIVKLSPTLTDIGGAARTAVEAGADAVSVVNTIPGLAIDVERRRPALGYGTGGVSGPGLLPVGVLATWKVRKATDVPIIGIGGISSVDAVLQYVIAGASLVAIGTGALRDPRLPERIVDGLDRWCRDHGVRSLSEIKGTLEWPS
jgi:dihydroorotate dehydrogenase (NAD+) catalytic subunit